MERSWRGRVGRAPQVVLPTRVVDTSVAFPICARSGSVEEVIHHSPPILAAAMSSKPIRSRPSKARRQPIAGGDT